MIKNKTELLDKLYSIKSKLLKIEMEFADVEKYIKRRHERFDTLGIEGLVPYNTYFDENMIVEFYDFKNDIHNFDTLINSFEQRIPKTNNVQQTIK